MAKFTPFPADESPVIAAGRVYHCRGCGGDVLDGQFVHVTTRDGQVVGVRAMPGSPGPGVPVTHECGKPDESGDA